MKDQKVDWSAAFDAVEDGIFIIDINHNILRANKAFANLVGVPQNKLEGKKCYDVVHGTDAPLSSCTHAKTLKTKKTFSAEFKEPHLGKGTFLFTASPVLDDKGEIKWVVHTIKDITKWKGTEQAIQALVESIVGVTGQEFFDKIASSLCEWLGTECVIIGQIVEENTVKAYSMQLDGEIIHDYSYTLDATPCENVAEKGYCVYPEGVCNLFPDDKDLVDLKAEGYVGTPLRDKNNKSIGILCVISRHKLDLPPRAEEVMGIIAAKASAEIERKQADEELKKSEKKYRELFDSTLDGVFQSDAKGVFTSVNQAMAMMLGHKTPQEVIGKHVSNYWVDPKDRVSYFSELKRKKSVKAYQIRAKRKDGSEVYSEATSKILEDEKGVFLGIEGILRDITDRKMAEEALRIREKQLADSQKVARLGSWEWDIQKNKITWSDELYRIFGLKPQEFEATYEAFLGMVHPDDKGALDNAVKESLHKKKPYHTDARIIRPDGTEWVMEARGKATYDESGNPVLMGGTAQDITEHKKAEEELKRKMEELERFTKLAVGRELKMIDLKKRIKDLEEKLENGGGS